MISKSFLRSLLSSFLVFGMILGSASAAKFNLRATANSNENDEDYDGLVVFKNYVEAASNGAISVELFIGTQLCSNRKRYVLGFRMPCCKRVYDSSIDLYIV